MYGTNISGATGLAGAFDSYIQGREDTGDRGYEVTRIRDVDQLENAFFGRGPEGDQPDTLPAGVITVGDEMRMYTNTGSGMFIPMPKDAIRELCTANWVSLVGVGVGETADSLAQRLGSIMLEQAQPNA